MNLFLRQRLPLVVFMIIIFISGIIFGAVSVKTVNYDIKNNLFQYFNDFMKGYSQLQYNQADFASRNIKFNLFNILLIWVLSISVVLVFLVPVLVFFKGFVLGFTVGFLISQYNLQGIMISLVTIFPQNVLIIPAYILAGMFGLSFSFSIFKHYRGRARLNVNDFVDFTLQMGILAFILLGGSLIETYVTPSLFKIILRLFE